MLLSLISKWIEPLDFSGIGRSRRFRQENWKSRISSYLLLTFVLFSGLVLRFTGHNWDEGTWLHPDERYLVILMTKIRFDLGIKAEDKETIATRSDECVQLYQSTGSMAHDCTFLNFTVNHDLKQPYGIEEQAAYCLKKYPASAGAGHFLDTQCSPLNPHNAGSASFAYGTFPLFLTRAAAEAYDSLLNLLGKKETHRSTGIYLWHSDIAGAGRALSSSFDVLSIFFIFLIGRRLHSRRAGILAAAFYAFSPLAIQLSHFATVNATAGFFVVFSLWFAHRVMQTGRWFDYLGFGFATAAALASRINLAPLVGVIVLAFAYRLYKNLRDHSRSDPVSQTTARELTGLLISALATLAFLRLFNPYAFSGPALFTGLNERWLLDIQQSIKTASGYFDWPPNWQWAGRLSYIYPLKDILLWGMGLSAGIPAILGTLRSAFQWVNGRSGSAKFILLLAWVIGYFGWIGGAWVMTMRYYLPIYGALAVLGSCAVWDLHDRLLPRNRQGKRFIYRLVPSLIIVGPIIFSFLWAVMFHNIYREPLTRIQGSAWIQAHVPADIAVRIVDAPPGTPLINIALENFGSGNLFGDELLLQRSSIIYDSSTVERSFIVPTAGTINELFMPHIGRRIAGAESISLSFELLDEGGNLLTQSEIVDAFPTDAHPLGNSYRAQLSHDVELVSGAIYWIRITALGGDLYFGGSIVSDEGVWDDRLSAVRSCRPDLLDLLDVCEYVHPYHAQILQYNMNMAAEDDPYKLEYLLNGLSRSDYLTISSNRFYDSQARNPVRFPLTNQFYDRLFNGELGYELVASFVEGFQLGDFRILDQRLPYHSPPTWLNQLEADEAFHVYDHPSVFIFQKRSDYDQQKVVSILSRNSLESIASTPYYGDCPYLNPTHNLAFQCTPHIANSYRLSPREIDKIPSQLLYSNEQLEIQTTQSTWSKHFDIESLLNRYHFLALVVWWLIVSLLGWIAWIPLFYLFPALADRGYGLARCAGLIGLSWIAWSLTSFQLPFWNRIALWLVIGIALSISATMYWQKRREIRCYLAKGWRLILSTELLAASLFLLFLLIRLSNPDLWHNVFGGEKMMDSAYLNGVLRSNIFPPINPWYSDSYINYYYFGFVLVGAPTLLSGIMPSVAYNLIIPTIFALTGISAFSLAYNVAARLHLSRLRPGLAGMTSLLLMIFLGNLDTLRIWLSSIHKLGVSRLTTQSYPILAVIYEGFRAWLSGARLPVSGSEWMWNPTRVIGNSINDNAITEFPFFTFLYGDLHAHMMALPTLMLTLAFVAHELLIAGQDQRSKLQRTVLLIPWAITTGLSWATNSWDWAPFTLLSLITIAFAWWQRWHLKTELGVKTNWVTRFRSVIQQRTAVLEAIIFLGGFTLLNMLATAPFRAWFATTSAEFEGWQGPYTPIWAYFSIHGHFIFLLLCLLIWISSKRYANWRFSALARKPLATTSVVMLLAAGIALSIDGRSVFFLILPLMLWTAALLLGEKSNSLRIVLLFSLFALGLTLIPELIRLRLDIGRQNTVFKLYFMGWQFFSIFGGVAFAILWCVRNYWIYPLRRAWMVLILIMFLIALAYPLLAIPARSMLRFDPSLPISLDGLEFMRHTKHWESDELFPLEPDYQIIHWLLENVEGAPVIMEGRTFGSEYKWTSRISSFTGLPSLIGWQYHQQQQRTFSPMSELIQRRAANVTAFYTTPDIDTALDILRTYDVKYVILGPLEHALYDRTDENDPSKFVNGFAKFETMIQEAMLEVVFELPYTYQTSDSEQQAVARILKVLD